ncbi:hypothetical protein M1403_03590 [Patescibacteria group bacterium]|nr:hypothetical protein [Patescibacteria group bacterium]
MMRKLIIVAAVLGLLVIAGGKWLSSRAKQTTVADATSVTAQASDAPLKSTEINREFSFPMLDASGNEITKLSYTIQSAELRNNIILRGQEATAAPGKVFLIFNLKLRNGSPAGVQLNTADYLRLNVNDSSDWVAAEITNDPVTVPAISTKFTRVGFPISTSDKDYKLQAGEIKGSKTVIPVNF